MTDSAKNPFDDVPAEIAYRRSMPRIALRGVVLLAAYLPLLLLAGWIAMRPAKDEWPFPFDGRHWNALFFLSWILAAGFTAYLWEDWAIARQLGMPRGGARRLVFGAAACAFGFFLLFLFDAGGMALLHRLF